MSFTYDLATETGRIRLLIADTDPETCIYQDEELAALLALAGDDVRLAGAMAIEAICTDRARLARRVRIGAYETEGQALDALMALAKRLRDESDAERIAGTVTIGPRPEHLEYWR